MMFLQKRKGAKDILLSAFSITATVGIAFSLSACNNSAPSATKSSISIVAAENEYGNVAKQLGGAYVNVTSVMSNPNTDPHDYEASPSVASLISGAQIVIQNGLGYDSFINKLESASPNAKRINIDAQSLLGLPNSTSNPHLWYKTSTMETVAITLTKDLIKLDPQHRRYFTDKKDSFIASLTQINQEVRRFKETYKNINAATTEPVSDYMMSALGIHNLTPWPLQSDIMNGIDPSPEDVSIELNLLTHHKVNIFIYNEQVTTSLTQSFVEAAQKAHIAIVGVYETMPEPGYNYQSWMKAEIKALTNAITKHQSQTKL